MGGSGKKESTSQKVLHQLMELIRGGGMRPDTVLAGEVELSRRLNVSRSAVREAIAFLKAFGIVRSQPGVGLIMATDPRRLDLLQLFLDEDISSENFLQIKQLRDFIELGSAHRIIRNATPGDIEELRGLIGCCEKGELTPLEFEVAFHSKLAHLSGNRFVIALSLIYQPLFAYHTENHPLLKTVLLMPEYIIRDHRAICEAIASADLPELQNLLHSQARHAE